MNTFESNIRLDSCLESFNKNNSIKSLKICNKVIEKFPNNPEPLVDRSLIYNLLGEEKSACLDINNAMKLIKNEYKGIDPLIKFQLEVRYNSCKKL